MKLDCFSFLEIISGFSLVSPTSFAVCHFPFVFWRACIWRVNRAATTIFDVPRLSSASIPPVYICLQRMNEKNERKITKNKMNRIQWLKHTQNWLRANHKIASYCNRTLPTLYSSTAYFFSRTLRVVVVATNSENCMTNIAQRLLAVHKHLHRMRCEKSEKVRNDNGRNKSILSSARCLSAKEIFFCHFLECAQHIKWKMSCECNMQCNASNKICERSRMAIRFPIVFICLLHMCQVTPRASRIRSVARCAFDPNRFFAGTLQFFHIIHFPFWHSRSHTHRSHINIFQFYRLLLPTFGATYTRLTFLRRIAIDANGVNTHDLFTIFVVVDLCFFALLRMSHFLRSSPSTSSVLSEKCFGIFGRDSLTDSDARAVAILFASHARHERRAFYRPIGRVNCVCIAAVHLKRHKTEWRREWRTMNEIFVSFHNMTHLQNEPSSTDRQPRDKCAQQQGDKKKKKKTHVKEEEEEEWRGTVNRENKWFSMRRIQRCNEREYQCRRQRWAGSD